MGEEAFARYLRLLGVPARAPGLEALGEVLRAHLARVPFENVSKLLHRDDSRRRLPALDQFLDGVEGHNFGGTCYANNVQLNALLRHLGYEAALCGADMSAPDVHLVNVVSLGGRAHLVDAGYGAPLLAPMPLDLERDQEVPCGRDLYVLRARSGQERPRLEHLREGRPPHGYIVSVRPRRIEEFETVIEASFRPSATFMTTLMVTRLRGDRWLSLRNLTFTESVGAAWWSRDLRRDDVASVLDREFGIPADLSRRALAGVPLMPDV